jgi:hypothetical protein
LLISGDSVDHSCLAKVDEEKECKKQVQGLTPRNHTSDLRDAALHYHHHIILTEKYKEIKARFTMVKTRVA